MLSLHELRFHERLQLDWLRGQRRTAVWEFVAKDLRKWLANTGAKTLYIEPGSSWENGYCESFNSELSDEFLNGEIFYSMKELRVLAERWPVHYNPVRPHSSLGYRPPHSTLG